MRRPSVTTQILVLVFGLAGAACNSSPALSDPRDIVTHSKTAMESVKTFHFDAEAQGQMVVGVDEASPNPSDSASAAPSASGSVQPPAPSGPTETPSAAPSGPASTSISLAGTSATGDVDLGAQKAYVSGMVPGLPGTIGQVVVIGSQAYVRATGETKFHAVDASSLPLNPADPAAISGLIQSMLTLAGDPAVKPVLVGRESCVEGSCYHVRVTISAQEASQQIGAGGIAVGAGQFDLWILTNGFRVARAEFTSSDPQAGTFWGRIAFSDYGKGVDLSPPSPDEIAGN